MNLDDLKERFREQYQAISSRVQESTAWNQMVEKYQDLSPQAQKAAIALVSLVFALIILSVPYSFYSSSQDEVDQFEDKKQLMRDLFHVSRKVNSLPVAPPTMSTPELQASVQNELSVAHLQPDQILSVSEFDNTPHASPTLPKGLTQKGVIANLHKLNLSQMVDLGSHLQSIRPTVKLVGVEVTANRDDAHYFDVVYKLVTFALPIDPSAAKDSKNSRGKKGT